MKVFISADMEGVSGVVSPKETSTTEKEYEEWRKAMTLEVNAAVEGCFQAGAAEVLVNDSHAGGRNILPELLHPDAILSRGQPLPSMIAPLDETYDAALLVGYHAMRGTAEAVLEHTYSGRFDRIAVNGQAYGETGLAALYAGALGVPVAFVSGDDKLAAEAKALIPHATRVITKYATGRYSARCISPSKSREAIRAGVTQALGRLHEMKPLRLEPPLELDIQMASTANIDKIVALTGVERTSGRGVRTVCGDAFGLIRFACLALHLASD